MVLAHIYKGDRALPPTQYERTLRNHFSCAGLQASSARRLTSMTSASSSSSVGFWPMDRMTPNNSLVEIVPLPSCKQNKDEIKSALRHSGHKNVEHFAG
jgi:hypothetical protein